MLALDTEPKKKRTAEYLIREVIASHARITTITNTRMGGDLCVIHRGKPEIQPIMSPRPSTTAFVNEATLLTDIYRKADTDFALSALSLLDILFILTCFCIASCAPIC